MENLISTKFLSFPNSCSSSLSPFTFTHLLFHRKPSWAPRKSLPGLASPSSSSSSDPNFINYGGWDDLDSFNPSPRSGKLDPLQNLLISVGIDGKKHFFLFLLGYISALSISRFKSLSWVVFPASVFIFVAGFWVGIVRSVTENPPNKIPSKEQGRIAVSVERMKDLISDLEIRVSCLRTGIEGTVKSNVVDMSEIRNYLDSIESFRLAILPVKNLLGELVDNDSENFCYDQMVKSNGYAGFFGFGSKNGIECDSGPSRRKRDVGLDGFDFKQFLRIFLRENLMRSHPQKSKVDRDGVPSEPQKVKMEKVSEQENGIKNPNLVVENNRVFVDPKHENMVTIGIEKKDSNWISENEPENIKLGYLPNAYQCQKPKEYEHNKNLGKASTQATQPLEDAGSETEVSVLGNKAGNGARAGQSEILAGTDIKISQEKRKKIANLLINNGHVAGLNPRIKGEQFSHSVHERYDYDILSYKEDFDKDNRSAMLSSRQRYLGNLDHENENKFQLLENDKSIVDHRGAASDIEDDDTSLFSTISDDEKFSKHLKEGSHLLKRARECLIGQGDEEMAEMILYKSARLFSRATAMRPASLLAVGQLGNTLLLHGELKLKISQELRTLLSRNDSLIDEKGYKVRFRGLNNRVLPKDKVASVLVDVCEECEELLVEAGRKYRMALSIDGDDVRALYNWGLALSFRAQLIADIGPEAAYDADKVYLAAIDKFNAMMSRSNAYTADALFRWGIALQQRSHLRPNTSKEKTKLLQQARRLFEDALSMESGNIQVREALSSCLAELNYRHF